VAALLSVAPGCQGNMIHIPQSWLLWKKPEPQKKVMPEDAFVLRGGEMVADAGLPTLGGDFEGARQLFNQKEYAQAEPIFGHIADNAKNSLQVMEAARYYQAECLYKRGKYPAASDYYVQLLNNFPSAAHGDEVRKRLFDIANYWLDETRDQMDAAKEKREGKRWFVAPIMPVHFEDAKPLLDIEGHALKLLEVVHLTDPRGPLGEKALFYIGSVKFYRESYKDADHYFYQLVLNYPNGVHAPKALQLAIICKQISTGGPDYDGRRLQEARDLIEMAKRTYPELQVSNEKWLAQQALDIHNLQAEKDYNIARFWERTGHPGPAHFYYEIVKRRYPGTPFAEKAEKRLIELRAQAQREEQRTAPPAQDRPPAANEMGPPPRPVTPGQSMPGPGGETGPAPRPLPPGLDGPR
jgi:TolA-binding protein